MGETEVDADEDPAREELLADDPKPDQGDRSSPGEKVDDDAVPFEGWRLSKWSSSKARPLAWIERARSLRTRVSLSSSRPSSTECALLSS